MTSFSATSQMSLENSAIALHRPTKKLVTLPLSSQSFGGNFPILLDGSQLDRQPSHGPDPSSHKKFLVKKPKSEQHELKITSASPPSSVLEDEDPVNLFKVFEDIPQVENDDFSWIGDAETVNYDRVLPMPADDDNSNPELMICRNPIDVEGRQYSAPQYVVIQNDVAQSDSLLQETESAYLYDAAQRAVDAAANSDDSVEQDDQSISVSAFDPNVVDVIANSDGSVDQVVASIPSELTFLDADSSDVKMEVDPEFAGLMNFVLGDRQPEDYSMYDGLSDVDEVLQHQSDSEDIWADVGEPSMEVEPSLPVVEAPEPAVAPEPVKRGRGRPRIVRDSIRPVVSAPRYVCSITGPIKCY
jgi:hypothetical protein